MAPTVLTITLAFLIGSLVKVIKLEKMYGYMMSDAPIISIPIYIGTSLYFPLKIKVDNIKPIEPQNINRYDLCLYFISLFRYSLVSFLHSLLHTSKVPLDTLMVVPPSWYSLPQYTHFILTLSIIAKSFSYNLHFFISQKDWFFTCCLTIV